MKIAIELTVAIEKAYASNVSQVYALNCQGKHVESREARNQLTVRIYQTCLQALEKKDRP